MPFIDPYYSCDIISEIHNNSFYKTYENIVYACGDNEYGQLGIGSDEEKIYIPEKVLIEEKIKDIKIDLIRTYFITFDSNIYACGCNYNGRHGIGSTEYKIRTPQKVLLKEKIKDIKIGFCRTHFITFDGKVYAYGDNKYGQLGIGSTEYNIHTPQKVLIKEKIKDIETYCYRTYFITFDDKVYACGDNIYTPQKIKKWFFIIKTCNAVY